MQMFGFLPKQGICDAVTGRPILTPPRAASRDAAAAKAKRPVVLARIPAGVAWAQPARGRAGNLALLATNLCPLTFGVQVVVCTVALSTASRALQVITARFLHRTTTWIFKEGLGLPLNVGSCNVGQGSAQSHGAPRGLPCHSQLAYLDLLLSATTSQTAWRLAHKCEKLQMHGRGSRFSEA